MINLNNLKAELVRNDINVNKLANILNKSVSTIYKKLDGTIKFSFTEIQKITNYLNININDLIINERGEKNA